MKRAKARSRLIIMALGASLMAGCASQPKPDVDPIFQVVPGGKYHCYYDKDNRNPVVKGVTSTAGQAAIGGAAGGLLGNQFGGGTGNKIATGAGAAAGVAAGAWNARRMQNNRLQNCIRSSGR